MCNSEAGSSPQCCKGILTPRVNIQCWLCLTVSVQPACAVPSINISADIKLFGHTKILHTLVGMGSDALAAAVLYPGIRRPESNFPPWTMRYPHPHPLNNNNKITPLFSFGFVSVYLFPSNNNLSLIILHISSSTASTKNKHLRHLKKKASPV